MLNTQNSQQHTVARKTQKYERKTQKIMRGKTQKKTNTDNFQQIIPPLNKYEYGILFYIIILELYFKATSK